MMGIPLSLVFAALFFASLGGAVFMAVKKAPVLARIPAEELSSQETFFAWIMRIVRAILTALHPQRIKMYVLAQVAKTLHASRLISFKMHRFVDAMAHTAKKKSQEMEQEHQSSSDARQEAEDQRDESDAQNEK
ncbi:MAG: hypothetical protein AAB598_00225 [Patescibacteria group bacterium]